MCLPMLRTAAPPGLVPAARAQGVPGGQRGRTAPLGTVVPPTPHVSHSRVSAAALSCLVPSTAPSAPHPAPTQVTPVPEAVPDVWGCAEPQPGVVLRAAHACCLPRQQGTGASPRDMGGQIRQFSRARCVVLHLLRWRLSYPGP